MSYDAEKAAAFRAAEVEAIRLLRTGMTMQKIGEALGGLSRAAVAGLIYRARRRDPSLPQAKPRIKRVPLDKPRKAPDQPVVRRAPMVLKDRGLPPPQIPRPPQGKARDDHPPSPGENLVGILDHKFGQCRWIRIEHDENTRLAVYCGAASGGSSWCPHHKAIAFTRRSA